jgi:acyl-CoA thioesterase YciA
MTEREPLIRVIAMPKDTNPSGDIFGGWLMAQMDLAAGNLAQRLAKGRCVTAAVDGMAFLAPVHVELLSVGRTSMKISIEAVRRTRFETETVPVTKAVFTFVALDEDRRPRVINLG